MYICINFSDAPSLGQYTLKCLTVQTFLLAFWRFSTHKSLPSIMISDNVSTFLEAAEDLQKLFESETLQTELGRHNVTWCFISKREPWYGGFNFGKG